MNDIKMFEPLWGSWYVKELIGEGGYGKVYRIEREEFGAVYTSALKHIKIPQSQSEVKSVMAEGLTKEETENYFKEFVAGLVKEVQLMAKLKGNSYIVSYEDHKVIKIRDAAEWHIFIRMELLTALMDHISKNKITRRDVIKLGIDICSALEICQKHNIIHRDIKPENIFVSSEGTYKLGDFGIARQLEKTAAGLSKKGTYSYMAPEVYLGRKYGSNVDIYSLGLVMYRLLNNNRTPFLPQYPQKISGADREKALSRRMSGESFDKPVNADGRLAEIVMKACAYDPRERYERPAEMRHALEAILYSKREAEDIYGKDGDEVKNNSVHFTDTSKRSTKSTQREIKKEPAGPVKNSVSQDMDVKEAFYEDEPSIWGYYKKGLKDCIDFSGRMPRKAYWIFTGINIALKALVFTILVCSGSVLLARLSFAFVVILTLAGTSAGVRRLHDTDRRGFFAYFNSIIFAVLTVMLVSAAYGVEGTLVNEDLAVMLVVLYCLGLLCMFIFSLFKGSRGENRFGKAVIYKKEGVDMSYYTSSAYVKPYFYKRRKVIGLKDGERVIISQKNVIVKGMRLLGGKASFTNYRVLVYDMNKMWLFLFGAIFVNFVDPKRVVLDIPYNIIERAESSKYLKAICLTLYLNDGNSYSIRGFSLNNLNEIFDILKSAGIECKNNI